MAELREEVKELRNQRVELSVRSEGLQSLVTKLSKENDRISKERDSTRLTDVEKIIRKQEIDRYKMEAEEAKDKQKGYEKEIKEIREQIRVNSPIFKKLDLIIELAENSISQANSRKYLEIARALMNGTVIDRIEEALGLMSKASSEDISNNNEFRRKASQVLGLVNQDN